MNLIDQFAQLTNIDLFAEMRDADRSTMVGRPFYLDFDTLRLLSNDHWKRAAGGVPAGTFLLCHYANPADAEIDEALLVRVLAPTSLPSDPDVLASMVDYYKEGEGSLDQYTRSEFQFSGLECRVLGTFYRDGSTTRFGGDIENFESPHNYRCVKPSPRALERIVNFREEGIVGGAGDVRIGIVRYSASQRMARARNEPPVPVYVSTFDFLGKRTALFGMTRTGKSNSVKKIVQATQQLSEQGAAAQVEPVGQIIFDINGEYANANQQDAGTAIFEQYADAERYSVQSKPGFKTMKLNFHVAIRDGHGLLANLLGDATAGYVRAFRAIDWTQPDSEDRSGTTRYDRRVACYRACIHRAGFTGTGAQGTVRFASSRDIRDSGIPGLAGVDPSRGISLEDAVTWFTAAWEHYEDPDGPFTAYKANNGRDWADEDLRTLMQVLSRSSRPGGAASELGYRYLTPHRELHTPTVSTSFEDDIVTVLRAGGIVIVDLSQGNPNIQRTFTDRLCGAIFADAMRRFVANEAANFIQLYFEEAHNLFPRRNETDLTLVYNRLAKEGQKLRLGLVYATQEVSSISASILKNTQNWFVSHLNNRDELREVEKYYDFGDFTDSLRRTNDKGFIRLKTDSNTFIVPIQVDVFRVPPAETSDAAVTPAGATSSGPSDAHNPTAES